VKLRQINGKGDGRSSNERAFRSNDQISEFRVET